MEKRFTLFNYKSVIVILFLNLFTASGFATTDSISKFKFIYLSNITESGTSYGEFIDTENFTEDYLKGFCVASVPFFDGVSTSIYPKLFFMTQPFEAKSFGIDGTYDLPSTKTVNLNELSNPDLKIEFTNEMVTAYEELPNGDYLYTPSFVVDVSRFPSLSIEDRFKALIYAKLAILGIITNIENEDNLAGYKAKIEVVGLPDQSDIVGPRFSRVFAQTKFPYTVGSPVVSGYKAELLSPFCSN